MQLHRNVRSNKKVTSYFWKVTVTVTFYFISTANSGTLLSKRNFSNSGNKAGYLVQLIDDMSQRARYV